MEQEQNQHTSVKIIIRIGKYKRCSTDNQELTLQDEVLTKFINRLKEDNPNNEYVIESYDDKGISGKTSDRPSLNKLLSDIEKNKVNCVIVTKLDRLGRSLQDLLEITTNFKNHNVDFIVVEQNIDTSNPQGKLLFHILGAFAEFERTLIRERMESGRKQAMIKGTKSGKPCHRPFSNLDPDAVEYKFKSGMSMNAISKFYNVSITPIRRILIERNII